MNRYDVHGNYPQKLAAATINEIAEIGDELALAGMDWQRDIPHTMYNDITRATIALESRRFDDAYALAKPALDILRGMASKRRG